MRAEQRRGVGVMVWIQYLSEGVLPKDAALARKVQREEGQYFLDDGVLFHVDKVGHKKEWNKQLVVPTELRAGVMEMVHEDPWQGGHFSLDKAMSKLQSRWWWWSQREDMKQWIRSCEQCQAYQVRRSARTKAKNSPRVVPPQNIG